jgi:hypothetical protein
VQVAEDPLSSVVLGAGKMLSDFNCCGRSRSNSCSGSQIHSGGGCIVGSGFAPDPDGRFLQAC